MKINNKEWNDGAAHLLTFAIKKIWKDAELILSFSNEETFYCDFKFSNPVSQNDFKVIEKQMKKIVGGAYKLIHNGNNEIYNWELVDHINGQCDTNNSIANTNLLKNYKLLSLAGAYLNNDSSLEQVTRIHGVARANTQELNDFLNILKERKERDHRNIGKELGIFTFSPLSGKGFPIWLPNGFIVREEIKKFVTSKERKYNFTEVITPSLGSIDLYKTSGHWDHYKDDNYPIIELDKEQLMLRPMTCPHHCIIYKKSNHSYKDLPIRLSEHAKLYRYESSGSLSGLERVRAMVLTDAHIFARVDQIRDEFKHAYKLINECLEAFNIEIDYISLSLRDPEDKEKFYDDDEMWNKGEVLLEDLLKELKVNYKKMTGEAAFYGPKLDIQIKTALGREITVSTLQLDFLLPNKFELEYTNKDNVKERPVMIHRGLIGTYERFVATLLEQTKGALPLWLSPLQVQIIPVSRAESHLEYCQKIKAALKEDNIRADIDVREERLSYKMRQAQTKKIPIQLIIGDQEVESQTINYRLYQKTDSHVLNIQEFIQKMKKSINQKCPF